MGERKKSNHHPDDWIIREILVEILATKTDQKFYESGELLGPFPSGAPAIFIDQAARMGAASAIIAKIGNDDFGKINTDRLSSNGVDVSHIIVDDNNTTGTAFVTYFKDGGRKFIYHMRHAACGTLSPDDIDRELIKNSKYLHIMGCSILGSSSMAEAIMEGVRCSRDNGVKISFDPNIRPELLQGNILDYFREILDASDIILTGKSELKTIFGNLEEAVEQLLKKKDRIIVLKDGSRGAELFTRMEKGLKVPSYPADEVDPTGAGDCFDGTFLAMLCNGADLTTAMKYASAACAKAVEKKGPMEGNSNLETIRKIVD